MKSTFILFISGIFLFAIPLQAYIILDSKTKVSPGCDGGVLSHRSTSFITSSFDEFDENDENLNTSDKEEG
jgi:hypothetical protein